MNTDRPGESDKTVIVGRYSHVVEAEMAKSFLWNHGIKASLQDEHTINMNWLYSNALGGVKLRVPVADEDQARQILRDVEENKYTLAESELESIPCPRCGSPDTERRPPQSKGLTLLILYAVSIPLPFLSRERYECYTCGHRWSQKDPSSFSYMVLALILALGLLAAVFLLMEQLSN